MPRDSSKKKDRAQKADERRACNADLPIGFPFLPRTSIKFDHLYILEALRLRCDVQVIHCEAQCSSTCDFRGSRQLMPCRMNRTNRRFYSGCSNETD
jgi:hypothetical protein